MRENKKNIDEVISALYLAKSDNREKMLSDLILTVMYNIDCKVNIKDLNSHIDKIFHLKPIEYELQECLDNLVENEKISQQNGYYKLLDVSSQYIHKTQLQLISTNDKRYTSFKKIILNTIYKRFKTLTIFNISFLLKVGSIGMLKHFLAKFSELV